MLGERFEAEIREQPAVWRAIAATDLATTFAQAVHENDVVLVGSGSSLFVAMLGALALRRRGVRAAALPATEAAFERTSYRGRTVIALSQSGRSADVLAAVETLAPERLIALTNDATSPLASRADLVLDSLPVGGARGTIEGIAGTSVVGRVFAKTGSMMHVRGLAGYLATLHHSAVTFAFNVDDWNGAYRDLAALRAAVLARIVTD